MKGQKIFCLLSSVPRLILAGTCFFILYSYNPAFSETLDKRVIEHTLKNGMKLLLLERHHASFAFLGGTVASSVPLATKVGKPLSG